MPVARAAKRTAFHALRLLSSTRHRQHNANCLLVVQAMLPLGGCVHATPLFAQLRHSMPERPAWVATRGLGLELLRHNPNVGGLLELPSPLKRFAPAARTLRSALQAHALKPAWVVLDANNPRSKIALLGALCGRAPLAGYSEAEGLLAMQLHREPTVRSVLEDNLRLGTAIGAAYHSSEPRVYISRSVASHARNLLRAVNPGQMPVVIFSTQASGGQPTTWREDRVVRVVEQVAARGMLPVFVGTAEQIPAIDRLRGAASCVTVSLAGKTDVRELAAVLALADLCISIDTGTMHVARASGVPLVVLAPVFQSPVEWLPLKIRNVRVVRGEGIHPVAKDYQLDEVQVPQVLAATEDLLATYPPSETDREARVADLITDVDHFTTLDQQPSLAA